jgi:hypothetical protein
MKRVISQLHLSNGAAHDVKKASATLPRKVGDC